MAVHELSRADGRRIVVRAQPLVGERPAGLLELVRHLTLLQIAGLFGVNAIHQDVPCDKATAAAVGHENEDLAHWPGLELMPR